MRPNRDKRELTERNQRMLAMRDAKKTFKEIAAEFKISTPRVHLIVARERQRLSAMFERVANPDDEFEEPPRTHYTYQITDPATGRFYVGVRTCYGNPLADVVYMGSGRWIRKMARLGRFLTKSIIAEYPTRAEAELAERRLIKQNLRHKNCMNSYTTERFISNNAASVPLT